MDPKRDALASAVLTEDYMLTLNRQDIATLRSQNATSKATRRETKYKPKAFKEKKRYVCFAIHSESYVYNCNFLKYDFLKNYNKC